MKRRNSPISSRISPGGRVQFSALKEKIVRIWMPISPAARTVLRSASTPRRCPSPRGNPRAAAQRPLPSMMIATWRGTSNGAGSGLTASLFGIDGFHSLRAKLCSPNKILVQSRDLIGEAGGCPAFGSDRHDLFFLARQGLVYFGDRVVGGFLHLLRHALVI